MFFWDDPRKVGTEVAHTDGTKYFRGPGAGTPVYLTHGRARSRAFIKGGDAIFLLTMEDVSHLVPSQPLPPSTLPPVTTGAPVTTGRPVTTLPPATSRPPVTTTTPSNPCTPVECQNAGVCVLAEGKAACRCAVGDDWWYWGDRCQHRGSSKDELTTALAASLSVLAAMLVVTAVSVVCVRRKYRKRSGDAGMIMSNVTEM